MRYTCLTTSERAEMLSFIGVSSIDEVYSSCFENVSSKSSFDLPDGLSESKTTKRLTALSNKNFHTDEYKCFLGSGAYFHEVPAAVDHLIQRAEFLTAYTPYQAEISQGTLQVLFEFQTILSRLTGMDISNASMYDGQTALSESVMLAMRASKSKGVHVFGELNPDYMEVLRTYYKNVSDDSIKSSENMDELTKSVSEDSACIVVQNPMYNGEVVDRKTLNSIAELCEKNNALMIVATSEVLHLGLFEPPSMANIVCGSAASLGVPLGLGGMGIGFLTAKNSLIRQIPGRICGATVDSDNKRAFVLTLSAREQHIKRARATSNICTNQGLCATAFTIHATLLGELGFKRLAKLNHHKACLLAKGIEDISGKVLNKVFFNEFSYKLNGVKAEKILEKLKENKIFGGVAIDEDTVLVAVTEALDDEDVKSYLKVLKGI